jgi:tetratricopeptide (TPR) repeat protein
LFGFYLENSSFDKARAIHSGLRGAINIVDWLEKESELFEYEGRYQDAIDVIESIPDRRNFAEAYTSRLSYLELKMGSSGRAVKRCREFLHERSFPLRYESEIINYECGKVMEGKNVDPKRVSNLAEATDREMVKGVCYSLLGEDEKALKIFRQQSEKRFSQIDDCLRWPAISRLQKELRAIRDELLKAKRSLSELPKE